MEEDEKEKKSVKRESSGSIEDKMKDKVKDKIADSVPGVKQAKNIKDKADKIKSLLN